VSYTYDQFNSHAQARLNQQELREIYFKYENSTMYEQFKKNQRRNKRNKRKLYISRDQNSMLAGLFKGYKTGIKEEGMVKKRRS